MLSRSSLASVLNNFDQCFCLYLLLASRSKHLYLFLLKKVLDFVNKGGVKGIAHITGGGFTDNIPRVFPQGLGAVIYNDSWLVPTVFTWIQQVKLCFLKYLSYDVSCTLK